jgi:hypothetical protein
MAVEVYPLLMLVAVVSLSSLFKVDSSLAADYPGAKKR